MKVAHIVKWDKQGMCHKDIASTIHTYQTTVTHILKWFKKSGDYYHINPKIGHPHKMDLCDSWIATQMIARVEAANTTKVPSHRCPSKQSREDPSLPVLRYDTEITVFGPIHTQETGSKLSPLWDWTSNFAPIHMHCVYDLATDEGCPHCIWNIKKFLICMHYCTILINSLVMCHS
jgi:hypothetical protein